MISINVFCPLYNAESYIPRLLEGLRKQKNICIKKIIFSVTESSDKTLEMVKAEPDVSFFEISKAEFSHSLTRERGMDRCTEDVVVFLSQDVILEDPLALYYLTKDIGKDGIVFSFARQTTMSEGIERYTREKNYPPESYIMSSKDIEKYQIKTFYSSDACAAYDRNVFMAVDGYDHLNLCTNEDMYYCHKVITAGYKTKYCADATVIHSHNMKIREVYARYYDTGIFFGQCPKLNEYKSIGSGMDLAKYVLKRALQEFNVPVLIRFVPDMLARYLGKRNGTKNVMKDAEKTKTIKQPACHKAKQEQTLKEKGQDPLEP